MSDHRRWMLFERELPVRVVLLLAVLCLLPLVLVFGFWTSSSPLAFPQFVIVVVASVYLPGKLLLDLARSDLGPLEDLTLSLVLGMTVSTLAYWITALGGLSHLFFLWPVTAVVVAVCRRRNRWKAIWRSSVRLDATHILLCLVIVVQLVPLAVLPMYYRNAALSPQGGMTFLTRTKDAIFHLSIANELKHSIPPEVPYLAGLPLGYHYGMDLLNAMLSNVGHLSVLDLTVRFTPTLLLVMTTLAIFCFSRSWLRSGYGAVLSAFLVILGEDLSFVPGLLHGSNEVWSAQFFGAPTTYSLYFVNPMLPALGILFSGLFCLTKFLRRPTRMWLILTGFLFAVAMEYKIFVTAQVCIVLAISAAVYLFLFRDKRLVMVVVATALAVAPFALYSFLGTEAGSLVWVRFAPWPYVPQALEELGLESTWLAQQVDSVYGGALGPAGLVSLCVVALPIYLAGSLGFRVLALPSALRGVLAPSPSTIVRFCLGLMVLVGPAMALTLSITPVGYPIESEYNQSIWFYVVSKYVASVLAVALILQLCRGRRLRWAALLVCAVVVLSVPSAAQFFHRQMSARLDVVTQSELELTGFLEGACSNGRVVLSRQRVGALASALTPCRVPALNIADYSHSFVSLSGLNERLEDRDRFWSDWNNEQVRGDILERYRVDYVVVDRTAGDVPPHQGTTLAEGQARTSGSVTLDRVMDNADFAVYRVRWDDE
jgi:hypothetical protein